MAFPWRGPWKPNTLYAADDTIEHHSCGFVCIADHVSSDTTEPGCEDETTNIWAHMWEKVVANLPAAKEPFYFKQIQIYRKIENPDGEVIGTVTDGTEFHIYIDEGPDNSFIVFDDVPDLAMARDLTNRLNNAIYRWFVKKGIR